MDTFKIQKQVIASLINLANKYGDISIFQTYFIKGKLRPDKIIICLDNRSAFTFQYIAEIGSIATVFAINFRIILNLEQQAILSDKLNFIADFPSVDSFTDILLLELTTR